jgi:uncharacterized phage protein gp47/JayE
MTITSVAAQVTAVGISAPSYDEILDYLKTQFRGIYGDDAYLEADGQDGQLLAIFAKALDDCNQGAVAVYNSFSPNTALGNALSNLVKINHIRRSIPSSSVVTVRVTGVVGTLVSGGIVSDSNGNQWALPLSVLIPGAGFVDVTATCMTAGSVDAAAGTVNIIATPQAGWQSVTNSAPATPGAPLENDAQLRQRQAKSTAIRAETVLGGLVASLQDLANVQGVWAYENDTNASDSNGLPPHSIAMVVEGGDINEVGQAIMDHKAPGVATFGTTTVSLPDITGSLRPIHFFQPTNRRITVAVTLHNLNGYTTLISDSVKQAVADYVNGLDLGDTVYITKLYLPAQLFGGAGSETFDLIQVQASFFPSVVSSSDLVLGFTDRASLDVADISITVV